MKQVDCVKAWARRKEQADDKNCVEMGTRRTASYADWENILMIIAASSSRNLNAEHRPRSDPLRLPAIDPAYFGVEPNNNMMTG